MLRCVLVVCPSSAGCDYLCLLLNRIQRFHMRNFTLALLEQLTVVTRDAPWRMVML